MLERNFQAKVVKWLRKQGCYVMTITVQPGIPNGTPDVFFCKEGFYGWLECKKSKNSKFQPLQKERLAKLDEWSWAKVTYPSNWDEIREELEKMVIY